MCYYEKQKPFVWKRNCVRRRIYGEIDMRKWSVYRVFAEKCNKIRTELPTGSSNGR